MLTPEFDNDFQKFLGELFEKLITQIKTDPAFANVARADRMFSPETSYDLLAGSSLADFLTRETGFAVYAEETISHTTRVSGEHFWLIDPIDGTNHFVYDKCDAACSVALISRDTGRIEYAAVYDIFGGVFLSTVSTKVQSAAPAVSRGSESVLAKKPILQYSRSETRHGLKKYLDPIQSSFYEIRETGSIALKMLRVCLQPLDFAVISLQPKNLWDVAGGCGLALANPLLKVTDLSGSSISFVEPINRRINGLILCAASLHPLILSELTKQNVLDIADIRKSRLRLSPLLAATR